MVFVLLLYLVLYLLRPIILMNFTSTLTATGDFVAEGSRAYAEDVVVANGTEDAIVDKISDRTDTIGGPISLHTCVRLLSFNNGLEQYLVSWEECTRA